MKETLLSTYKNTRLLFFLGLILPLTQALLWVGDGGLAIHVIDSGNDQLVSQNLVTGVWLDETEALTFEAWVTNPSVPAISEDMFLFKANDSTTEPYVCFSSSNTENTMRVFRSGRGATGGDVQAITDTRFADHLAWVVSRDGTGMTLKTFKNGGEQFDEIGDNGWDTWESTLNIVKLNDDASVGGVQMGVKLDNVRVWTIARSQEEIRENMHRLLDASENPGLEMDFRFPTGVHTNYVNYGNNDYGYGDLTHSGDYSMYSETQLEITDGYGLDTFTGVSAPSDPSSPFEFPFLGGDSTAVPGVPQPWPQRFVLDVVPDVIEFPEAMTEFGVTTLPADITVAMATPTGDVDDAMTYFVEYHFEQWETSPAASLKTRAYFELTPFGADSEPPFPWTPIVAAVGGAFALVLVVGMFLLSRRSSGNAAGGGRKEKASLRSNGSSNGSAESTVGAAINNLLSQFTVRELNVHVSNLIAKGESSAALALALKVEQKAVGGPVEDYTRAIENVGDALCLEDGIPAVKQARRTTMGMKGKVKTSQLDNKALVKPKKSVKKVYARRTRKMDEDWEASSVRQSVKTPISKMPISQWMGSNKPDDLVTLTSSMAPHYAPDEL